MFYNSGVQINRLEIYNIIKTLNYQIIIKSSKLLKYLIIK